MLPGTFLKPICLAFRIISHYICVKKTCDELDINAISENMHDMLETNNYISEYFAINQFEMMCIPISNSKWILQFLKYVESMHVCLKTLCYEHLNMEIITLCHCVFRFNELRVWQERSCMSGHVFCHWDLVSCPKGNTYFVRFIFACSIIFKFEYLYWIEFRCYLLRLENLIDNLWTW